MTVTNDDFRLHRRWVKGLSGKRLIAPYAQLANADLSGFVLGNAFLLGADLRDANLSETTLGEADLSSAELIGANLSNAILSGANLSNANLSNANLSGARLIGAKLIRTNLKGANLSGAKLLGSTMNGAKLEGADLSGAELPVWSEWAVTWNTSGSVTIGCKTKHISEWDEWFASDDVLRNRRGTLEFEMVEAAYEHAKRMYQIWKKQGA